MEDVFLTYPFASKGMTLKALRPLPNVFGKKQLIVSISLHLSGRVYNVLLHYIVHSKHNKGA